MTLALLSPSRSSQLTPSFVRRLANTNMEQSVSKVCPKELVRVSEEDVDQARRAHERLIVRLMVSPGDSEGAMRRAEDMFGLPYWAQHNLRHKRRATAEFVAQVYAAWTSVLEASVQRDVAELLRTEAAQ